MARRLTVAEPTSRLALWAARLAWFALAVAALSILIVRTGFLEVIPALVTFGGALVCAGLAILTAFAGAIVIWRQGLSGIGRLVLAVFIGSMLLVYPAYLAYRAYRLPAIFDITTNPQNPPRFDVTARLRPRGSSEYPGAAVAAKQRAAYPDIAPLQVMTPPKAAFDTAMAIVAKRKWVVVDARAPAPPTRREGTIEAIARSPIMGIRDDVVIRITPVGNAASQVDVRSASRLGYPDFGDNASRIRALLEEIDDQAPTGDQPQKVEDKKPAAKRPQPANQRR